MNDSEKIKVKSSRIKCYAWILVIVWSIFLFTLLLWDINRINDKTHEYAHIDASTAFDKDILYRQWSTMHGGVYVLVTNITQPNPYLSDIPERDVTTPSGRQLTLITPEYMTHQVFELERNVSGAYSHITSLKPTRPENAPDTWEIKALTAFESGEKEVSSIETINGTEYFRLMRPLITTKGCLKCHYREGYKENDIRGGISVSLPMDSIRELSSATLRNDILIYIILWLVGISGIAFGYFQVSKSDSKRTQIENSLKKSKEFAETVINSINEAIAVIDINNFRIIDVNSVFLTKYGKRKEEVLGKTCYEVIHSRDKPCTPPYDICPLNETLKTGKYSTIEHVHFIKSGDKRYVEVSTSPIIDENGMVVKVIHLERDITERKRIEEQTRSSLEEKEVLLREIHHRVKNNMQIVSSLLMLQSQNIEDKQFKDIFIDSQNRIQAMALIHEKLYQSTSIAQINLKEYIQSIVSNISESYGQKSNIKIDINVENILIKIDYAVPCGLIINELVTNSIKYAFPDGRQGIINISAKSIDNGMIQFSISDDGIGIAKDLDIRNTKSLGLRLITSLAESQLHGEIILNRENGTEFQIIFRQEK